MKNLYVSILLITTIFTLLLCFSVSAVDKDKDKDMLYVGSAKRIVTPDPLLPVSGGVGTPEPVEKKIGDLFARAMVMKKGDVAVAIVSLDFLGWSSVLADKIRALAPQIPPENIIVGVTHTHSAPETYGFVDEKGNCSADLKYLDWVCQQAGEAINEAYKNMKPAYLKIAMGEAKGKIAYNYYADELYDRRCSVLQAISAEKKKEGKPIVTLVNYAIHPEVIGDSQKILSPDLCGPLYDKIEADTGGMAMFMNSAQGGMVTADCRGPNGDIQTWDECVRIGELLASEALRIVKDAPVQKNPTLYCTNTPVEFPIDSPLLRMVLKNSPIKYPITEKNTIPSRINLINVGTAQIVTIPGEALPNIGFYLKRKMPTPHPFLFGLTNDAFGYILTKVDWNSFKRYEYISRTGLGEMTGEILIDTILNLVNQSPKPDPVEK
ncbi:MAG TPA: hypothetical protein PLT82_02840 [Candidatus Hydrogenedens sp.]|nr:hypothetical protein [Candidatus Hydrogenedens sp.]HOL19397.1 hypothetical protein [Candidatus Hydrogenedens sp.]HPP58049.1 hypothetical protein [Candidatus Hydrogenedens sp.]